MKKIILFILIGNFSLASGQQGPTVDCFNCEGTMNVPIPVNGSWYNPDQSGTGYLLEVQNGRLLGYYFGYDTSGDQQWLIFQGDLEKPEEESEVLWQVNSTFLSFRDGNAFNEPHTVPSNELSGDSIFVEFLSKHNARISVNGEAHQNFIPIVYGVGLSRPFEETKHNFPNMQGMWSFVYKRKQPETLVEESLFISDIYQISSGSTYFENDTKFIKYFITKFFTFPPFEILGYGYITCSNPIDPQSGQRQVACEMFGFPSEPLGSEYSEVSMIIPLGDLGAFNFTAELTEPGLGESGFTIEATRVNFLGTSEGQ